LSETERLLQEIKEELGRTTSILDKILKKIEEYVEFRKAQSR